MGGNFKPTRCRPLCIQLVNQWMNEMNTVLVMAEWWIQQRNPFLGFTLLMNLLTNKFRAYAPLTLEQPSTSSIHVSFNARNMAFALNKAALFSTNAVARDDQL